MIGEGKVGSTQIKYNALGGFVSRESMVHASFDDMAKAIAAATKQGWKRVHRGSHQLWIADNTPRNAGGIIVRTYKY